MKSHVPVWFREANPARNDTCLPFIYKVPLLRLIGSSDCEHRINFIFVPGQQAFGQGLRSIQTRCEGLISRTCQEMARKLRGVFKPLESVASLLQPLCHLFCRLFMMHFTDQYRS